MFISLGLIISNQMEQWNCLRDLLKVGNNNVGNTISYGTFAIVQTKCSTNPLTKQCQQALEI